MLELHASGLHTGATAQDRLSVFLNCMLQTGSRAWSGPKGRATSPNAPSSLGWPGVFTCLRGYRALQDGWTPLRLAAWRGHTAIAQLLLAAGADCNAVTSVRVRRTVVGPACDGVQAALASAV